MITIIIVIIITTTSLAPDQTLTRPRTTFLPTAKLSPAPPTHLLLLLLHLLLLHLQPPKLIPPAVSLTPASAVQNQILHSSPSLHFGFCVSSKKPLLHQLHSSCCSCNWQNQTKSLFGFIASCSFTGGWCRVPVWLWNNLSGKSNKWEQFWRLLSCDNPTRTSAKICKISYKSLRPVRPGLILAVFQINMHRGMKGFQAVSLPYAILDLLRQNTKWSLFWEQELKWLLACIKRTSNWPHPILDLLRQCTKWLLFWLSKWRSKLVHSPPSDIKGSFHSQEVPPPNPD